MAGAYDWQLYKFHVPIVLKSGSLNLLEPSEPVQGLLLLLQQTCPQNPHIYWHKIIATSIMPVTLATDLWLKIWRRSVTWIDLDVVVYFKAPWQKSSQASQANCDAFSTVLQSNPEPPSPNPAEHETGVDCVWNVMSQAQTIFRLSAKRTSAFKSARGVGVSFVDYWQPRCAHQR